MQTTTVPTFTLYVVWHPAYQKGRQIADLLRKHFGRDLYRGFEAEHAVSVLERSESAPGARTPLSISWDDSEFTAVVVLAESALIEDPDWTDYVRAMASTAQERGLPAGFFPVIMERRGLELGLVQQALRWDCWVAADGAEPANKLTLNLTHEFCRMVRHGLKRNQTADGDRTDSLGSYLEKVRVFISHSKHDDSGKPVANDFRNWIHEHSPLDSFLDVPDIPPGLSFEDVLLHQIKTSVLLAVHTDSYSSREWCRREVIEAKRRLVPMVVVDCVQDVDPRGMPYLGNVPIIRMRPGQTDRIGTATSRLLDEVFRNWLWLSRVRLYSASSSETLFSARPPELITLAARPQDCKDEIRTIVYPAPLLGTDDQRLFNTIAPGVSLQTLPDWLENRQ